MEPLLIFIHLSIAFPKSVPHGTLQDDNKRYRVFSRISVSFNMLRGIEESTM